MNIERKWVRIIPEWIETIEKDENWHIAQAEKYGRWNMFLGIPTVALSAVAGTTIFTGLAAPGSWLAILTGGLSMLVAALSAISTFSNFQHKHESHRQIATRCRAFKIELTFRKEFIPKNEEEVEKIFLEIKRMFQDIPPRVVKTSACSYTSANYSTTYSHNNSHEWDCYHNNRTEHSTQSGEAWSGCASDPAWRGHSESNHYEYWDNGVNQSGYHTSTELENEISIIDYGLNRWKELY